jgi:hypothetical protein
MDAQKNSVAEMGLSKQKSVGFHQMTITLPEIKFVAYSKAISKMLSRGWTLSRELELNKG